MDLWIKSVSPTSVRSCPRKALILFLTMTVAACHALEPPAAADDPRVNVVTLTGTLRLVGNEPFTALVLETPEKKLYLVTGALQPELSRHQQSGAELTGVLEKADSPYARSAIRVQHYKLNPDKP